MKGCCVPLFAGLFCLIGVAPTLAHHSFSGQYDKNQPVSIVGVVSKVEWQNPHVRLYVETKDNNGKIVNWEIELSGNPISLARAGWKKDSVTVGDKISVDKGFRARSGDNIMNAATVLKDGRRIYLREEDNAQK